MSIVTRRPTTPGQRGMQVNKQDLTKKKPEKSLTQTLKKHAGRDRFGKISIRHRGGGNKRKYRVISTLEKGPAPQATIKAIEYDPNRSANIALVEYETGEKAYILAAAEMVIGQTIHAGESAPLEPGNRVPVGKIPRGFSIYDVAIDPNKSGTMVRAAGTSASIQAMEDDGRYVHILLPSGEVRRVLATCYASIGTVSNPEHAFVTIGKAGRVRHMGRRPQVRGKAMNPNDHPHGGGEGAQPIGLKHPKTPWGKAALGVKTRKNKRTDVFIVRRRAKKKR